MQYVQVNKSYVLDTKTNKLQPMSGLHGVGIDTPWWLWPDRANVTTLSIKGNTYHQVDMAKLCNLAILAEVNHNSYGATVGKIRSDPTSETEFRPIIKFKDAKTGEVIMITIDIIAAISGNDMAHPKGKGANAIYPAIVSGITYNLVTSHGARRYITSFQDSLNGFTAIKNLPNLAFFRDDILSDSFVYNFGLSERQFEVIYQGRPLEGTCYAYMFGTLAVLLRDDFSFDSLVALKGCRDGVLKVERFMFSTNDFIKSLMGWG